MFADCNIIKITGNKADLNFSRLLNSLPVFAVRSNIRQRGASSNIKFCYFNLQVPIVDSMISQVKIGLTNIFKGIIQNISRSEEIIYGMV